MSVTTPLFRLPRKFKEILGAAHVKSAYQRFYDEHEIVHFGRQKMLNPRLIQVMPDGSWEIQPHLIALVEAYEPDLLRSASDRLRRRQRYETTDSASAPNA